MQDETTLVRRALEGDADAFGALYDAYIDRIYRLVWYKTHHRETAEDLTSFAFTKALEKLGTFDVAKGNFSGWLYRIARNVVIDHYRSRKTVDGIDDAWDLASGEDVARDVEAKTMVEALQERLGALTPDQRDVVVLRAWEGLSYAEIADALGKSEPACRMAFMRGAAQLRDLMPVLALLLLTSTR